MTSLDLLQSAGVENAEHYAEVFDAERRKAEALTANKDSKHVPTVLFVCGQNAGRSQLAEAVFKQKVHDERAVALSAGSVPAKALNPVVKQALEETKVDTSVHFPKPVTKEFADAADVIVAMGCDTACPHFKGKKVIHWELPDAKGKDLAGIREIKANVSGLVDDLIKQLGVLDAEKSS